MNICMMIGVLLYCGDSNNPTLFPQYTPRDTEAIAQQYIAIERGQNYIPPAASTTTKSCDPMMRTYNAQCIANGNPAINCVTGCAR